MEEGTLAAEEEPMELLEPVVGAEVWVVTDGFGATAAVAMAAEEAFREDIDVMRVLRVGAFASCVGVQNEKGEAHRPAGFALLAARPCKLLLTAT